MVVTILLIIFVHRDKTVVSCHTIRPFTVNLTASCPSPNPKSQLMLTRGQLAG